MRGYPIKTVPGCRIKNPFLGCYPPVNKHEEGDICLNHASVNEQVDKKGVRFEQDRGTWVGERGGGVGEKGGRSGYS